MSLSVDRVRRLAPSHRIILGTGTPGDHLTLVDAMQRIVDATGRTMAYHVAQRTLSMMVRRGLLRRDGDAYRVTERAPGALAQPNLCHLSA